MIPTPVGGRGVFFYKFHTGIFYTLLSQELMASGIPPRKSPRKLLTLIIHIIFHVSLFGFRSLRKVELLACKTFVNLS